MPLRSARSSFRCIELCLAVLHDEQPRDNASDVFWALHEEGNLSVCIMDHENSGQSMMAFVGLLL